jgi:hypothetical protein
MLYFLQITDFDGNHDKGRLNFLKNIRILQAGL